MSTIKEQMQSLGVTEQQMKDTKGLPFLFTLIEGKLKLIKRPSSTHLLTTIIHSDNKLSTPFRDEKESLKHVSNELKNLAVELDIPIITAHQLNREVVSTIKK